MAENEVKILIKNNYGHFQGAYPRDVVDDAISAFSEGYRFAPAFKARRWDGRIHLLSRAYNTFPAGVLDIVTEALTDKGYTVLIDNYDASKALVGLPKGIIDQWKTGFTMVKQVGPYVMRDYQEEAGQAFLSAKSNFPYNGILHMATASGKTVVAAAVVKTLYDIAPLNVLFLVHGKSLVTQAKETFLKCFSKDLVGVIQGTNIDYKPITIASVDSINSKLKAEDQDMLDYLDSVQLVIPDECHRFSSKTYINILKIVNAPMRLALSGTPIKKQNDRDLLLHSQTGPVLYRVRTDDLQEQGHVATATLTTVVIDKPVMNLLPWRDAYNALIVEHDDRTALIAKMAINRANAGKTILILAGNSIAFAEHIDSSINLAKLPSSDYNALVDGTMDLKFVDKQFDRLRKKEINILTTTMLADEGIDIPDINVLMLVGGGKSYVKAIQRIGRGLRVKEDGGSVEVIDFFDITNPYLSKHAKERLKYYREENIFKSAIVLTYDDAT